MPGQDYPVVSDHFTALTAAGFGLGDALLLLHALELSGPHWKRDVVGEFTALGDAPSAVDCDYDWADESGHIRVGLAWTRHLYPGWTKRQVIGRHAHLKQFWAAWMQARHADGTHGYGHFLPRIERLSAALSAASDQPDGPPARRSYGGTDVFDFDMGGDAAFGHRADDLTVEPATLVLRYSEGPGTIGLGPRPRHDRTSPSNAFLHTFGTASHADWYVGSNGVGTYRSGSRNSGMSISVEPTAVGSTYASKAPPPCAPPTSAAGPAGGG